MHVLASIFQDGSNPFPVTRLPVLSSVTDSLRHTLLLPTIHSYGSRQVYIRHRRITGFHVVQEATCTHAHEYRLLGASCLVSKRKMYEQESFILANVVWFHVNNCCKGAIACLYQRGAVFGIVFGHQTGGPISG